MQVEAKRRIKMEEYGLGECYDPDCDSCNAAELNRNSENLALSKLREPEPTFLKFEELFNPVDSFL